MPYFASDSRQYTGLPSVIHSDYPQNCYIDTNTKRAIKQLIINEGIVEVKNSDYIVRRLS